MSSLEHIDFLNDKFPLPLRFSSSLPFSSADKKDFPWLASDRYYTVTKELKRGGRAIAYLGQVCDARGRLLDNTPSLVLKLPNIDTKTYATDQIKSYLERLRAEGGREWQLTRSRLRGCAFANPIFDFSVVRDIDYCSELMPMPVTAQLFVADASPLDDYLVEIKERSQPYMSRQGVPVDNWRGITDHRTWVKLARGIATGLADIHLRRVVHGDIWPPNIFIRKARGDGDPQPVFIDFGESFPIEPKGNPQEQRDHAYRAPERRNAQSVITEQADVYSFGKLLLHLATGDEPILSSQYSGHRRREKIRERFEERNPNLLVDNPFIIDAICKCVALDPVDRPRMAEIARGLASYIDRSSVRAATSYSIPERLKSVQETWQQTLDELAARDSSVSPYLQEIVTQKIEDLEWVLRGLSKDVVDLWDTRENLILFLVNLFQNLDRGDQFISLTSPQLWQGGALGLDGRYFTATALAVERGASIQRSVVFSIQEVGHEWTLRLIDVLNELCTGNEISAAAQVHALQLSGRLATEAKKFWGAFQANEVRDLPPEVQQAARERLGLVVKSYVDASRGVSKGTFHNGEYESCSACKGLYVGLIPVSTLSDLRMLKAAHPVSVFVFNSAKVEDRYLLMMTDCVGRNSIPGSRDPADQLEPSSSVAKPELRGLRVFKSVLGVPEDRIKRLEQRMRTSISVGGWINDLSTAIARASAPPMR